MTTSWTYPGLSIDPYPIEWATVFSTSDLFEAMQQCPQDPRHHAEGNVWIHTRMVCEALRSETQFQTLPSHEKAALMAAALLHDSAKPQCTETTPEGRVTSKGHALKAARLTRRLLYAPSMLQSLPTMMIREQIVGLVRFHGLPLAILMKDNPERAIIEASQFVRCDHLELLAKADILGRECEDQDELLERISLFTEMTKELGCETTPFPFSSPHHRVLYFRKHQLHHSAYINVPDTFEVTLMSGLPCAGKDTWIKANAAALPMISLDKFRLEMGIAPTKTQGKVVQAAKAKAREYLQRKQPFVWNATNITKNIRSGLIRLFMDYGAKIKIIYVETPWPILIQRNTSRPMPIPKSALLKLAQKLEVPDPTEAHVVLNSH